jgi:hypothetical protein
VHEEPAPVTQAEDPGDELLPIGQGEQLEAPAPEKDPLAQSKAFVEERGQ